VTSLVVDASVVVAQMLPETLSAAARRARSPQYQLQAPALLPIECFSAIWKRLRRGQLDQAGASTAAEFIEQIQVELQPSAPLLRTALNLAATYDRSIYDSLYIALALRERCQFVTADERLYNSIAGALPGTMLWVGDLPQNP
jgi:predicted nucleic acid-binding protein